MESLSIPILQALVLSMMIMPTRFIPFVKIHVKKLEYWVTPIHVSTEAAADFNRFQFEVDPVYACVNDPFQFYNNTVEGCIVVSGQVTQETEYFGFWWMEVLSQRKILNTHIPLPEFIQ